MKIYRVEARRVDSSDFVGDLVIGLSLFLCGLATGVLGALIAIDNALIHM